MPSQSRRLTRKGKAQQELEEHVAELASSHHSTLIHDPPTGGSSPRQLPMATRQPIPTPIFDGTDDVDSFISNYQAISTHNNWIGEEKKIRLKLALKGPAARGAEGDCCEEIYNKLRAQYGLTSDTASTLLRSLKLKPKESIHQFGEKVLTLVHKAFPNLDKDQQDQQAKQEVMCAVATIPQLSWTLRLSPPNSLVEAIDVIHKYQSMTSSDIGMHRLESDDVQDLKKQMNQQADEFRNSQKLMMDKFAAMQVELTQQLIEAQRQLATTPRDLRASVTTPRKPRNTFPRDIRCYNCQGSGHIARNCQKVGNEQVQQF